MKIRSVVRLSQEFQVVESEAEIEVKNDCDMQEAFEQLNQELIVASSTALQKVIGQKKAVEKNKQLTNMKGML